MLKGKAGAFQASPAGRGKPAGSGMNAKAGSKPDAGKTGAVSAPQALVWDKPTMKSLLYAVRAECLGEVTLSPMQDDGYLGRIVARVRTPAFKPTDSHLCLKLAEWHDQFGGSQEAFESCEMFVQRSDAGKRHEGSWASQAASVSRSAVGDNSTAIKRVPRLSFQGPAAAMQSPKRKNSVFSSHKATPADAPVADEPTSQTMLPAARPVLAGAKGKKQKAADEGKGKQPADETSQADEPGDESESEDNQHGRRTRRKLLDDYPNDGGKRPVKNAKAKQPAVALYHPLTPASQADKDKAASCANTAENSKKSSRGAHSNDGCTSSRSAPAAARSGGGGSVSSGAKPGAARRLAWAATANSSAPADPNAGVSGFLLRARTAIREAGGAEKYASADGSGGNAIRSIWQVLSSGTTVSKSTRTKKSADNSNSSTAPGSPSKKGRASPANTPNTVCEEGGGKLAVAEEEAEKVQCAAAMSWATTIVRRQVCVLEKEIFCVDKCAWVNMHVYSYSYVYRYIPGRMHTCTRRYALIYT